MEVLLVRLGEQNVVEKYDGTTWTEVANLLTARDNSLASFGTQTAALGAGGEPGPLQTHKSGNLGWNIMDRS